jgi:site-specific recombinase XerD
MNGADLKTVSELLGHADTRMTERYSPFAPTQGAGSKDSGFCPSN